VCAVSVYGAARVCYRWGVVFVFVVRFFFSSRRRHTRLVSGWSSDVSSDLGSIGLAARAFDSGAQIVRVHDVAETVQLAQVWRGLRDAALTAKVP